jgi:hypothetical protein
MTDPFLSLKDFVLAMHSLLAASALLLPSILALGLQQQLPARDLHSSQTAKCRTYPGDAAWPTAAEWHAFNQTIGGRLVATVPLAAPCHNDEWAVYNNETCAALQHGWLEPQTQYVARLDH